MLAFSLYSAQPVQDNVKASKECCPPFYYAFRSFIHRRRRLLRLAQVLRAYLLLGPLKTLLLRYHLKHASAEPLITDATPLFNGLDTDQVVIHLDTGGYAPLGPVPEKCLAEILAYCEKQNRVQYWNPHRDCPAISRIAHNRAVVEIARKYFGAEPVLWLTQLKWSSGISHHHNRFFPSIHEEPTQYDTHSFHYDANDIKSLTLFVYLTDVDAHCGPHVVIEGTHKTKSLKELARIVLDDDRARKSYGERIKPILGEKGTAFIEDTHTYHKASAGRKIRGLLSIDYVLRRKVPPERPVLHKRRTET